MAEVRTEGSINSDRNSSRRSLRSESRRRRIIQDTNVASMNVLSANYESLDYDNSENYIFLREERLKGLSFIMKKNVCRWVIFLCIGIVTAFVGIFIDVAIEEIAKVKYSRIKTYLDDAVLHNKLYIPFGIWIAYNVFPVLIGSLMVVYIEPMALGSGIPQVKCYLNGVKIPRIVRVKTLLVKSVGVITAVVGGLAGGKEGPMIHSGAVVAAGISQGKSTSLKLDFGILKHFRDDREKRDFVSGGAAAGVAAAFGAPVGGVLFSLEEGASFWNQSLTWRIFFASMVSTFTLNIVLSAYHGYPGHLSYPGLLNFGKFTDLSYELFELVIFIGIGAVGGLAGALYNYINYRITLFRMRYMKKKYLKVMEALVVAAMSATVAILMIYFSGDCKPLGDDPTLYPVQMFCPDGQYNTAAALWLQVPEASVRSFFHDRLESIDISTMVVFALVYYCLSIWTYGISVSAGLFIPNLLIGAAWGRLIGVTLQSVFPGQEWTSNVGKYALAGAAAQLGGVVRMTISLTAILIEATGNITFGLPLMLILLTAKWVGDFFTEGLYDIHIQLNGIPLLPWEPPPLSANIYANEVMSYPVITFKVVENVGHIVDTLKKESYHGFVVVDPNERRMDDDSNEPRSNGRLRGLILRHQLIIILKNKVFNEVSWDFNELSVDIFRKQYPRYPSIDDVHITDEERNYTIDLSPFMNPSPYVVQHMTSLPRVFRLFRALGLRHVIVINDINEVVGIISRIDLARYRVHRHLGKISVEEMKISSNL
ncbi:H(+)/Cl(-) exchange transporter 7 [Planococcus citri]|uniref:H(+)/Cl(-) exchange transporter 7 n=1 Tax=Planococcus citri TaxID=170843 RepID=UPI0031F79CB3